MATSSSAPNPEWLIIIHDVPGSGEKRKQLMGQHAERRRSDPQGFWVFGGALLDDIPGAGKFPGSLGSCMLACAETKAEVVERIKSDILVAEKVWDAERLEIYPFFRPVRAPV